MAKCDTTTPVIDLDVAVSAELDLTQVNGSVINVIGEDVWDVQINLLNPTVEEGFTFTLYNRTNENITFTWGEIYPHTQMVCIEGELKPWYDFTYHYLPAGRSIIIKGLPLEPADAEFPDDIRVNSLYIFGYMEANY